MTKPLKTNLGILQPHESILCSLSFQLFTMILRFQLQLRQMLLKLLIKDLQHGKQPKKIWGKQFVIKHFFTPYFLASFLWKQLSNDFRSKWEFSDNNNLRDVSQRIASPSTSHADAFVFLCFQNNAEGTVGIAWLKTTCGINYGKTSINEYKTNDIVSAKVKFISES